MRRLVGFIIASGLTVTACTQQEPVGPLVASTLSSSKEVVVTPSNATIAVGGTQQFAAQFFQSGKEKKAQFTWSSSNPLIATVNSAGTVTGVSGGEVTITATTSMTSGTAHVTVQCALGPPQVSAHIPLSAGAFGSVVSAPGVAWVTEPSGGVVSRVDVAAGAVTGSAGGGPWPAQVSANQDGSRIYVPSFFSNGMVTSDNTATLAGVDTVFATQSGQDAYGVANTPAGDTVFLGITNGPVFKIAMHARQVLGEIDFPVAAGYHFEWNLDRTRLFASQRGFDGGRVFEIDPASFTPLRTFETGGGAQAIQLSADGSKLFVAAQNGGVIVWDIASNSAVTSYATPGCSPYGMVRTPDNRRLWVGCVSEGQVIALDPASGALLTSLNVGGTPRELSYDASSCHLIVPNEGGWVDIVR